MTMRKVLVALVFSICIPAASILAEAVHTKTLKIGAVLSLTGDAASSGEAIRKGIILATEELKRQGWTVDVNFQDDATNPTKTVSSLQYLVTQGNRIFIGPTWSYLVNAAKPLLEKSDAIAIVPAGSSDIIGGASKAVLNLCPSRAGELSKITDWLKSRSHHKAFILTPLGDWGVVHRDVYQKALKTAGIEVVGDQQFDYGIDSGSLRTLLLQAKSRGADILLTTASGGDLANMLKTRSELKWKATLLSTEDLWDSVDENLISENSPALEDTWVIGLPLNQTFAKRFQSRFNETPKMYADRAYDAVMLLAKAIEATDGTTEGIRSFLRSGKSFVGVTGEITFNDLGDRVSEEFKVMAVANNKERA